MSIFDRLSGWLKPDRTPEPPAAPPAVQRAAPPAAQRAAPSAEPEPDREGGTILWFHHKRGFGFIRNDRGERVFLHHSEVVTKPKPRLRKGLRVEYTPVDAPKGPRAEEVDLVSSSSG